MRKFLFSMVRHEVNRLISIWDLLRTNLDPLNLVRRLHEICKHAKLRVFPRFDVLLESLKIKVAIKVFSNEQLILNSFHFLREYFIPNVMPVIERNISSIPLYFKLSSNQRPIFNL